MPEAIRDVVDLLGQIEIDSSVPKNIRIRVKNAMDFLEEKGGRTVAVRADKALEELDSIADDSNLPTYTRTQIWHIVSLLERHK